MSDLHISNANGSMLTQAVTVDSNSTDATEHQAHSWSNEEHAQGGRPYEDRRCN